MREIQGVKLYDMNEVAEMLNISKRTITTMMQKGQLLNTRIGRKIFISEESIKDYLNGWTIPRKKSIYEQETGKQTSSLTNRQDGRATE